MPDVDDANAKQRAEMLSLYNTLIDSIRATDETSFKLLNVVPVFAGIGSGALSVLQKGGQVTDPIAAIALSLIGCVLTAGFFRWEIRNIQKCDWFISRAARLEQQLFPKYGPQQFAGFAKNEHVAALKIQDIQVASIRQRPWGKTQAEKLIYLTAILAWLIPAAISVASLMEKAARR